MQLSNHLVNLPAGKEITIDLKDKQSCRITFIAGEFPGSAKASTLHISIIGYMDKTAQDNQDENKTCHWGEVLTLNTYPYKKSGHVTINKTFSMDHPIKLLVTYRKMDTDDCPCEVEMGYSLL